MNNGIHVGGAADRPGVTSPVDRLAPVSSSTYFSFPLSAAAAAESAFYPEALMQAAAAAAAAVGRQVPQTDLGGITRPDLPVSPVSPGPGADQATRHADDDDDDDDAMSVLSCPESEDDTVSPGYTPASASPAPAYVAASTGSCSHRGETAVGLVTDATSQHRTASDVEIITSS